VRDGATTRIWAVALGAILLCSPFLVFPEFAEPARPELIPALVVTASITGIALVRHANGVPWLLGIIACAAWVGWLRSPNMTQQSLVAPLVARDAMGFGSAEAYPDFSKEALQHLGGIAFGLLCMGVVAAWGRTEARLTHAAAAFCVGGAAVLALGLAGMSRDHLHVVPAFIASWLPRIDLGLPGLELGALRGAVNANAVAGTAALVAPVGIALAIGAGPPTSTGRLARAAGGLCAALAAAALVVTLSRGALLAAAGMTAVAFARLRPQLARRMLTVGAIGAGAAAAALWAAWSTQVVQSALALATIDMELRARMWRYAIVQLSSSPWLGIGLNQFHLSTPGPEVIPHAHNIFIQVALDIGLVGLSVYLAFNLILLARADRMARHAAAPIAAIAAGAGLSLVGVHLFGVADAVALGARVGVFQWLAAGLILAASDAAVRGGECPPRPASPRFS
jgi:putative inorganic carbon (HCO3(-)) transporter